MADPKARARFMGFIQARHMAYLAKQAGGTYTADPIIAKYRFCNVYRKLDRVTQRLDAVWYTKIHGGKKEPDLWFAAVVARLINNPEALEAVGSVLPWNPMKFAARLLQRQADGKLIRNTAYIVSTNGRAMPFVPYIVQHVLTPLWGAPRGATTPLLGDTLTDYAVHLEGHMGLGSFLVGQVIADLKYYDKNLLRAPDWKAFVVPGPGSKRGLNRLLGLPHDKSMPTGTFMHAIKEAQAAADQIVNLNGWPLLDAQDVQNCLCEFDKHERARWGQGKPKQLYRPHGS